MKTETLGEAVGPAVLHSGPKREGHLDAVVLQRLPSPECAPCSPPQQIHPERASVVDPEPYVEPESLSAVVV